MECEEKLSCDGAAAVYRCNECESVQCSDCKDHLHELGSLYKLHVVKPLLPLCKGPCNPKQLVSIFCEDCRVQLCKLCDQKMHSGRRSDHRRSVITGDVTTPSIALSAHPTEDRKEPKVEATPETPLGRKEGATHQKIEGWELERRGGSNSYKPSPSGNSPRQNEVPVAADLISLDSLHPLAMASVNDPQQSTDVDLLGWNICEEQPATAPTSHPATAPTSHPATAPTSHPATAPTSHPAAARTSHPATARTSHAATARTSHPATAPTSHAATVLPPRRDKEATDLELGRRDGESLLLVNAKEQLTVGSADELVIRLGIDPQECVKVVSIFGNTGDGKSHTLNHAFFNGRQIFSTSPHQSSCTIGVWCAYDPVHHTLFLDTEGMLGDTVRQKEHIRLLLKILAISDVVIYRTQAERLHNDMYVFLSEASQAYQKFFDAELKAVSEKLKLEKPHLGPVVVVFHETQHTELLGDCEPSEGKLRSSNHASNANKLLQKRFNDLKLSPEAFSGFHYIGTRTQQLPTDFHLLVKAVRKLVKDNSVRSPRRIEVVYKSLEVLNEKFSHDLPDKSPISFADEYFTCRETCSACNHRCMEPMNHEKDEIPHKPKGDRQCLFKHELDNKIYLCETCNNRGKRSVVVPKAVSSKDSSWVGLVKYAWSGFILECAQCGIIYRSRQSWFGNQGPVETGAARIEVQHVWPGSIGFGKGTHNAARRLIESVATAASSVGQLTAPAANMVSEWVHDRIAPSYWVPNSLLKACKNCNKQFASEASKHHCRACGEGFCDTCSSKRCPVPSRGWGCQLVRVCDACFERLQQEDSSDDDEGSEVTSEGTTARKVTEAVCSAVGVVASAVGYSKDLITDSARPEYWVPDADITHCAVCNTEFEEKITKHHCRACGEGVCNPCSSLRRPVPSRGWDHNVRVCHECAKKKDAL